MTTRPPRRRPAWPSATGFSTRPSRQPPAWPRGDRSRQALVFSPLAWLKLKFFCHAGETEVGGFGISADGDPLYVKDFATVLQTTTAVTVAFDDAAVADHLDAAVDRGLRPERVARLWCHTHPGDSPEPSSVDEQTFARVFGACDWAVMFILSRTGRTYARLAFSAGPGGQLLLPVEVDWEAWPGAVLESPEALAAAAAQWAAEFDRNVHPEPLSLTPADGPQLSLAQDGWVGLNDWVALDEPNELQALAELAERTQLAEEDLIRLQGAGEAVRS
jgi:proteasome lid subunit RPN8/RPN11